MLTESQVREIVQSSLKATGVTQTAGRLGDAGVTDDMLKSLVIKLASDPTSGVPRFQHVFDVNKAFDSIDVNTTIEDLPNLVQRLSAGKLCSNPTNPHEQTCCPYPPTCPICGYPVR